LLDLVDLLKQHFNLLLAGRQQASQFLADLE
jgi:hypothetical protein